MNAYDETRRLYAQWYAVHSDEPLSWRRVRLRLRRARGHYETGVSRGGPFGFGYGSSLEGATRRQALASFRAYLIRDLRLQRSMRAALPAFRARLEAASLLVKPRILSPQERAFCKARGWTPGYDLDDERFCPVQLCHLVEERPEAAPQALCSTPFLWLYGGAFDSPRGDGSFREEDNRVSCPLCLLAFERLRSAPSAGVGGTLAPA